MKWRCSDEKNPRARPYKFSNQKLKDLGLEFTPVKKGISDTVKSFQEKGRYQIKIFVAKLLLNREIMWDLIDANEWSCII